MSNSYSCELWPTGISKKLQLWATSYSYEQQASAMKESMTIDPQLQQHPGHSHSFTHILPILDNVYVNYTLITSLRACYVTRVQITKDLNNFVKLLTNSVCDFLNYQTYFNHLSFCWENSDKLKTPWYDVITYGPVWVKVFGKIRGLVNLIWSNISICHL